MAFLIPASSRILSVVMLPTKNGIVEPDEITEKYVAKRARRKYKFYRSDRNAPYADIREYDLTGVSPTHLHATLRGGRVPGLQKHIKAVTYHNLKIVATVEGFEATLVFDV